MKKLMVLSLVVFACNSLFAGFVDTFDSIDPAWVTDRYEPAAFDSVSFDGDNRLKVSISADGSAENRGAQSGGYYNTQGRQRAVSEGAGWVISGDLYVSEDLVSGNNLRRTDLWGMIGEDFASAETDWPIIGIRRFDPADPFNSAAPNISSTWRVWSGSEASWVDLDTAITLGWHTLSIKSTGSSYVYSIDGAVVYTDTAVSATYTDLSHVFVQAYNFNGDSSYDYDVYWDNVTVVPEPATMILLGLGGLLLRRRK